MSVGFVSLFFVVVSIVVWVMLNVCLMLLIFFGVSFSIVLQGFVCRCVERSFRVVFICWGFLLVIVMAMSVVLGFRPIV